MTGFKCYADDLYLRFSEAEFQQLLYCVTKHYRIFAGQLRGHTLESKWEVYNEVKRCGFKNMIVASFSHMTRVDDVFVKQLVDRGEDRNGLYGFSEITHGNSVSF